MIVAIEKEARRRYANQAGVGHFLPPVRSDLLLDTDSACGRGWRMVCRSVDGVVVSELVVSEDDDDVLPSRHRL